MGSGAAESFALVFAQVIRIVFSPLFPVMLITLCAVSYVLTFFAGLPQFVLFAYLAYRAIGYAFHNLWAAAVLSAFVLAALPLAWIAFREAETRASWVIGHWVAAVLLSIGLIWFAHEWPYDETGAQRLAFGFLLFCLWADISNAFLITFKLVALSRPQPGREVVEAQKAHGDAALAGEAEAVALLNPQK